MARKVLVIGAQWVLGTFMALAHPRPAQQWASSAMTRSKAGTRPSRIALAISGDDW